jgi:tetratricopeptide (TPR) repeat protein
VAHTRPDAAGTGSGEVWLVPDDPTSKPMSRHELAAELRQVLQAAERRPGRASRLKRKALARRVGISVSSLYAYLDGTTLPPAGTLVLLLDELDVASLQRQKLVSARDCLELSRRSRVTAVAPRDPTVPRQLPADVPGFTGRAAYLDRLDQLLSKYDSDASTVVITAIGGMAGVGKTALSLHWAHRVADRFPDGQLYVNLRGFSPDGQMVAPTVALRRLLDALLVPPERIPADLDAQAALYRSMLAGRRMLVLLDNARDAEQVRPLLPGTGSVLALITSRNRLTPLVATEGAQALSLDLLSIQEARELLAMRLGTGRVAAEPEAVNTIIEGCGHLPLALAITAAHAQQYGLPLAVLAADLRDTGRRLDTLDAGDPTSQVRAVLSWSYATLTPPAARLLRLLSLHPGPDISAEAAASLGGHPPAQTRPLLIELTRASLVTEHRPGRYTCHDLLRAYATELAAQDPEPERRTAVTRLLDHYTHTAYAARRLMDPARESITLTPPQPGTTPQELTDYHQALAWLTAEHEVLLAALDRAAALGFDSHTWLLAWAVLDFLWRRAQWHELAATQQAAVAAGGRLNDPLVQARALRHLASAYTELGRFEEAHTQLRLALDLDTQSGDLAVQAHTHHILARLWGRQDRHGEALDHSRRALDLYRAAGHRHGQARALNAVGWYHALLGDHRQALTYCQQALPLYREIGHRFGLASTWDSLGYAHRHLGQHTQAVICYQRALDLHRELGDRYFEAEILTHLGDTHKATEDLDAAHDAWQQALTILDEIDHADADQLRAKLATLVSA